jgi:hypothetical protein
MFDPSGRILLPQPLNQTIQKPRLIFLPSPVNEDVARL